MGCRSVHGYRMQPPCLRLTLPNEAPPDSAVSLPLILPVLHSGHILFLLPHLPLFADSLPSSMPRQAFSLLSISRTSTSRRPWNVPSAAGLPFPLHQNQLFSFLSSGSPRSIKTILLSASGCGLRGIICINFAPHSDAGSEILAVCTTRVHPAPGKRVPNNRY